MIVTAIIPTFNRAWSLRRSVQSVFKQSYSNLQLIVVDDGSTDETDQIIKALKDKCPTNIDFQYYKQSNKGVSAARNFAVEKADGSLLAFLDSDDEWLPDKLTKQVDFLKQHPDIPLVHGEEIWMRQGVRVNSKNKHKKTGGFIFQKCLKLCLISPSCSVIRKKIYQTLGGFNEKFPVCEDYDLWLRLTSQYEIGFLSHPVIIKYGGHEDQLSQKYRAMDYWRILSMWSLIEEKSLNNFKDQWACLQEIIYKSQILISGYKKHQNLIHLSEIENINQQVTEIAENMNLFHFK